jgi:hypothetical protein
MLLSQRRSFLQLCFAETCRFTAVPPRRFRRSTCVASSIRSTVPAKSCVPTTRQLKDFNLDDSYGKLQEFADCHLWSTQVHRHNDPEDGYHIGLHDDFCVISHQNEAAFDVLRMNMSSLWMLTHAFRAIKAADWGFQLNADVTGKLCRKSVDLLAFSVTSISKRNNTLCLCIIPSTTESEQAFTVVFNE